VDMFRSNNWLQGQILEKPCWHSSGYSFDPIFLDLLRNVNIYNIRVKSEHGWVGSIKRSTVEKSLLQFNGHYFAEFISNSFILVDVPDSRWAMWGQLGLLLYQVMFKKSLTCSCYGRTIRNSDHFLKGTLKVLLEDRGVCLILSFYSP